MAGLQTIVDKASALIIDRRKLVGIQVTRNEIPRVSITPTKNPWRFTLEMPSSLRYYEARDLLEELDTLDRIVPQIITFSNNQNLNWIFKYRGAMVQQQIDSIRVVSFVGNQLTLGNLPITTSTRVLFEPNDLIQIGAKNVNPYPFTVVNRVTRGTSATVTLTTHRPNILTTNLAYQPIIVGNQCQFYMHVPNMPIYKLVVGGAAYNKNNTIANNARIEWMDSFSLYENTAQS